MLVVRAWAATAALLIGLAAPARAVTYTWTGGGAPDASWSNPLNWGGAGPDDGESGVGLVFPPLAAPYASDNDLNGLQLTSLDVTTQLGDGDYVFTGNPITIAGPVTMASPDSGDPSLVWRIPATLGADVAVATSGRQTRWESAIDLGSATLTLDTSGDLVLAGAIGGTGNLVKNVGSALTITAANSYTGATTCNAGALYIRDASAFGDPATGTVFNGGFLGFAPGSSFAVSEPFVFKGGDILSYGTPTIAGPITLDATTDVDAFEVGTVLTIAGAIAGPGALAKSGPGLLVIGAAAHSYAGATTVGAGALQLDGALPSTSALTVRGGATLKGNGSTAGAIVVDDGGTIAPGESPGELSSSGLSLASGAVYRAEIDGPIAATDHDTLSSNGTVSLGGATLDITLGFAPPDGQQFTLISQSQAQAVSGTFAGLPEGARFEIGGTMFGLTYEGGSGNDVVLVAAPPELPTETPTVPGPTATATHTPPTVSGTATSTPTPTVPAGATPTATGNPASGCTGDCDGNGIVSLDELVTGVGITLEELPAEACAALDGDADEGITIADLILAVQSSLHGCVSPLGGLGSP